MTQNKKKKHTYLYAVGRRKTAVARIRFTPNGDVTATTIEVNARPIEQYFTKQLLALVKQPLDLINQKLDGNFQIKVTGGGLAAQAVATSHGIARLLLKINEEWRGLLKSKGCLTRDPRMKERKKPGLKRARRAPQWSKR